MKYAWDTSKGYLYECVGDELEFITTGQTLEDALEYVHCAEGVLILEPEVEIL